jgi:rSAM/selenodomain-associated transferase 2
MKPPVSIIIPVLNESEIIGRTIENICSTSSIPDTEIIVVDGSPDGETINAIEDKRVIKLISEKGRGRQMNKGAALAKGDVLLFLHADTWLPDNAFDSIDSTIEKGCKAGAFELGIASERHVFRLIEKAVWFRSRFFKIPYGDQAIFARKDYFHKIGGFKEMPIMEDLEFVRRVKKLGDNIHIIPHRVKTSPRKWEKDGVIYCTLRNWLLSSLFIAGVSPEKLVRFYYR